MLAATFGPPATATTEERRPAVIGVRVIGHSVKGRDITAYRVGEPRVGLEVVALAAMHGNEKAGRETLQAILNGSPVRGVDLWIVPTDNPDGARRDSRHNARGVDLNRNFPKKWAPLTGYYYAGPHPASEPETRGLMRFLDRIRPDYVISFHQPLYGIDTYGSKDPAFARRLADALRLPTKEFACGGVCHGTLTQWMNAEQRGTAVTVEYGSDPSWRYLNVVSPRGLLRAVGGRR